jgi:MFS family permease
MNAPQRQPDGAALYKPGMFESLKIRDFRLLWFSNMAGTFAMQMQMVARGWLIYDMTKSPLALTWVMLSFMLPSFLFSLLGGVIADRVRKRPIMIASQVLNTIATIALGLFIYTGEVTFAHFIWFGVFNGTVLSMSMPARSAVIPDLVPREMLVNAMALQSATFNLSRIVGPALAGGLIALFASGSATSFVGVGIVFFVIAALYLTSMVTTMQMHYVGAPEARAASTMGADAIEVFRYMRDEKLILGLLIMGFVPFTFGFAAQSLLPAFNHDVIEGGPDDLGLLMTAMGVGALLGSLILARVGDIGGKGRVMFVTAHLWAVSIAVFALTSQEWTAMLCGAFTGLFGAVFGSVNMSIVQLAVRPEVRGRVMSINMMTMGLMPLGIIPISAAAEYVGIDVALLISAVLLGGSMAWLGWAFPDLKKIDKGHGVTASVAASP